MTNTGDVFRVEDLAIEPRKCNKLVIAEKHSVGQQWQLWLVGRDKKANF